MAILAAAEFKAKCLAVIDQVATTGEAVTITKHGKPLVKVIPFTDGAEPLVGRLAGSVTYLGDIIEPIDVEWEAASDESAGSDS
jgi:prevent-host-death family protein